jgi:hypothetical protein
MILTYSSPSIGVDRLIYLTIETKIKPHTAGTISKSNVKIKVTSKKRFGHSYISNSTGKLPILANLDLIYFALQQ